MNIKKKRAKDRRRARKLADQAWEEADRGNLELALKIIRRAVDLNPGSPVLWNDQGLLLRQARDDGGAAESFEAAISLSADFAEAYAHLAEIRARQGDSRQAAALQRQAVRHEPQSAQYREKLAVYELLAGGEGEPTSSESVSAPNSAADGRRESSLRSEFPILASRVDGIDWPGVSDRLTRHGYALLPQLLPAAKCAALREMFDCDELFSRTVTMSKRRFGKGVYRYFAAPLPTLVDALRQLVYRRAAPTANQWQQLLGEDEFYPAEWAEFRRRCVAAGQGSPSPLLLRYEAGGFNAPHRDIRGEVYFPLQLLVVLSPRANANDSQTADADSFKGGDFLFCDDPIRKESDRRRVAAGLGDAVLFCTRTRLVRIGGAYGLKPVLHGMDRVESGIRYALGVPFHDFTEAP